LNEITDSDKEQNNKNNAEKAGKFRMRYNIYLLLSMF